jgi:hypothetical protein
VRGPARFPRSARAVSPERREAAFKAFTTADRIYRSRDHSKPRPDALRMDDLQALLYSPFLNRTPG